MDGCLRDLRVLRAQTAQEGEEKLRHLDFRLFVCADELPDVPGLMLVAQTMEIRPAMQRILLCRDLDNELLIHAMREGSIVHYLTKPVDPEAAARLIEHELEQNRVMENLLMTRRLLDEAQTELRRQSPATGVNEELRRGGVGSVVWLAFVLLVIITLGLVGLASFYLLKSAVGVDIFPGSHLKDFFR